MTTLPANPSNAPAAAWPTELTPLLDTAITTEYASLTRDGRPITVPVTPYRGATTLDVSTGVTYPAKAERARRDPRVALLFADPVGTGLEAPPVVLVQGLATVRDHDLQAGLDRYVRVSHARLPGAYVGTPWFVQRRSAWYFARIWVEVTPLRVTWWEHGHLDAEPQVWTATPGTTAPPSDPAPSGATPRRGGPPPPTGDRPRTAPSASARLTSPSSEPTAGPCPCRHGPSSASATASSSPSRPGRRHSRPSPGR